LSRPARASCAVEQRRDHRRVAIQIGLGAIGRPGVRDGVADLDFVATSVETIKSSVVGEFLVSHYHVERPGVPKFMIQLVDPESRIRVDVFPDLAGSIADARVVEIGEHRMRVLPLKRILEHKVKALARASRAAPIDPKHVDDARTLGALLLEDVPAVPSDALARDLYSSDADQSCQRCILSRHPAWPLAPKDQICRILGWDRAKA
jgi:hypothetical protein